MSNPGPQNRLLKEVSVSEGPLSHVVLGELLGYVNIGSVVQSDKPISESVEQCLETCVT